MKERFGKMRTLVVDLEDADQSLIVRGGELSKQEGNRYWLRFNRNEVSASDLITQISQTHNIKDLTVEEPDIESIISRIYQEGFHEKQTVQV